MTVQATAVWRVRPSGSNTNGGGYDAGLAGAATDYSQQNAAQATGTNGSATGTTTFTDATALAFTSAMVGNAMYITGGGLTTGFYFVTGFTSSSIVTLDRTPGTGTLATWNLGGGWADYWTNTTSALNYIVPGNQILILGSGTPNPASYTYDYTCNTTTTFVDGNTTNGRITFANDPGTPGYLAPPNTTGGMPVTRITGGAVSGLFTVGYHNFQGIWFVGGTGLSAGDYLFTGGGTESYIIFGSVADQFGFDFSIIGASTGSVIASEFFSSVGGSGTHFAISTYVTSGNVQVVITGSNIHDTVGPGLQCAGGSLYFANNIVAKCGGDGLTINTAVAQMANSVVNNTIDGNTGHGINIIQANIKVSAIFNNIISNHTGVGKYGIRLSAGTAAANSAIIPFCDYNIYYNNTADLNNLSYGPHDTHGGSNPYVGQATENYTLA